MATVSSTQAWAEQTFGHVRFPDRRNAALAVRIAAGLVERPFAKVSEAFPDEAMRQAVYDLLEHPACHPQALIDAAATATAKAASAYPLSLIPLDGVSLTLRDPNNRRESGSVGRRSNGARGLHVMDAVGLNPQGDVLGLAGMIIWARSHERHALPPGRRPVEQRELKYWLELRAQLRTVYEEHAPATVRVFLHDSGADAWPVLLDVLAQDKHDNEYSIVRAAQNRRASSLESHGHASYLWPLLKRASMRDRQRKNIPAGHRRAPRRVLMDLAVREVTLDLKLKPSGKHAPARLFAIHVRELGHVRAGQERLELMLLTDHPVETLEDAWKMVRWYMLRWRVEDQHKAWKKSGSDIERMQLGSGRSIAKWMVWHAAVAARALQLVHQSRDAQQGSKPADGVFTRHELQALRLLRAHNGRTTSDDLTVRQAVELIAKLGGYESRHDRLPGPMVVQRGLEQIFVAAAALEEQAKQRPKRGSEREN